MATHRYVNANGLAFFVRKGIGDPPPRWGYRQHCIGSWAIALDNQPGERVPCPVCGKVSVITPVNRRVHTHYSRAE